MKITIYHNPSCSKSCDAYDRIQRLTDEMQVINYIETPVTRAKLVELISMLEMEPEQLLRKNEAEFGPYADKQLSREECVDLMIKHPVLIQRPIVVKGNKAVILRPPQTLSDLD